MADWDHIEGKWKKLKERYGEQWGKLTDDDLPTIAGKRDKLAGMLQQKYGNCPYRFDSDMPAATFCVYRGVAFGGAGEVCGTEVVVIWSSFAVQAPVNGGPAEKASASNREVYLGFAADPELVVRAIVDSPQGDRAEMVEYTLGGAEALRPIAGEMTLRAVRLGSADMLTMDLREPRRFHPGTCAFASYSGTFLGMMHSPSETMPSVDPFIVPRQGSPREWGSAEPGSHPGVRGRKPSRVAGAQR